MFLGPVRGTVVKIFPQILGYKLRLHFRCVRKLSGWGDEAACWLLTAEAVHSRLGRDVPQRSV